MTEDLDPAGELYPALRDLALRTLRRGQSELDPTELVHEAWARVAGAKRYADLPRVEFLALCATLMRRLLVDEARKRVVRNHDPARRLTLAGVACAEHTGGVDLLGLDEALTRLVVVDPRWARVVELRFFGGLSIEQVAEVLSISERTVLRDWTMARAWLKREIEP